MSITGYKIFLSVIAIFMVLIFVTVFFLFASISGPPGDLYVYLDVEDVRGIKRDGINLLSTLSITYLDAILGAVVKVIWTSNKYTLQTC